MTPIHIAVDYDSEGDILYITFGKPRAATGYQLSDQLLLRLDTKTDTVAVSQSSILHTTLKLNAKSRYPKWTAGCLVSSHPRRSISSSLFQPGKAGLTAHLRRQSLQEAVFAMSGG